MSKAHQDVWSSELLKINEQKAFNKAPEVAQHKQEEDEAENARHLQKIPHISEQVFGWKLIIKWHNQNRDAASDKKCVIDVESGGIVGVIQTTGAVINHDTGDG